MKPKPVAVFTSDLPDDFIIEDRQIVRMGGRNVAEEIRGLVLGLGSEASMVIDGGASGWGFSIHTTGEEFWCHIRSYFPAYLLVLAKPHWSGSLTRAPGYGDLWNALNSALLHDPQFHDVRWYESVQETPPPPDSWFGWTLGVRKKPPGVLARYFARPLGWLLLFIAGMTLLDTVSWTPVRGLVELAVSAVLLSIGYKVSHVWGVRLPWVRFP